MRDSKHHQWKEFLARVLWYGGSTFDAWLNISSAKMSSRILTMPQSTAQMGLASAIPYQIFQMAMGAWVQRVLSVLYLKHRSDASTRDFKTTTQLHEVIGGLLGPRWRAVSLLFNASALFYVSSLHFLNSGTIVYLLNDTLDKRTWTCVFAGVFFLSIFIPNAHNYRVWSFIGVVTTIFVSGYLTGAALTYRKIGSRAEHTAPHSLGEYYRGLSGFTVLGHVVIPIELMDAMWKPEEFPTAYGYAQLYLFLVTFLPSLTMYNRFGDLLLQKPNAIALFPSSKYHDAAIILLLVHLFINFGLYSLAVYAIWEKYLRVHDSASYCKKILARIPVFVALWMTALAFPFFGIVNKMFDTTLVIWNYYVIPCTAYIVVFWSTDARQSSKSLSTFGWAVDLSLNLGIILWVVIVEGGLALWANATSIRRTKLQLFAKCYSC